jgi:hypothetical protein
MLPPQKWGDFGYAFRHSNQTSCGDLVQHEFGDGLYVIVNGDLHGSIMHPARFSAIWAGRNSLTNIAICDQRTFGTLPIRTGCLTVVGATGVHRLVGQPILAAAGFPAGVYALAKTLSYREKAA